MKKLIQLLSVCLLPFVTIAASTSPPPVFQMRLVLDVAVGDCDCDDMVLVHKRGDTSQKEMLHVQHLVLLNQSALKSATVTTNQPDGSPRIEIAFTDEGKKRFAEVTRQSIGKRLAIVIGGQLYSAPKIMTEISGGTAAISGSFSQQEATELVAKITESIEKR